MKKFLIVFLMISCLSVYAAAQQVTPIISFQGTPAFQGSAMTDNGYYHCIYIRIKLLKNVAIQGLASTLSPWNSLIFPK